MMEMTVVDGKALRKVDPRGIAWPDDTQAVLCSDNQELVGILPVLTLPHLEGPWIRDDHRGSMALALMEAAIENDRKSHGKTHLFAFSENARPEIGGYLARLGFTELPMKVWIKEL